MKRIRLTGALLTAAVVMTVLMPTSPASADSDVLGCTAAGWPTCVMVRVGGKNYGNRTQWVGRVQGYQTQRGQYTPSTVYGTYEVWGDGFYYKTVGNGITRYPNRWVRSGTNVCTRSPLGAVACRSIRV